MTYLIGIVLVAFWAGVILAINRKYMGQVRPNEEVSVPFCEEDFPTVDYNREHDLGLL